MLHRALPGSEQHTMATRVDGDCCLHFQLARQSTARSGPLESHWVGPYLKYSFAGYIRVRAQRDLTKGPSVVGDNWWGPKVAPYPTLSDVPRLHCGMEITACIFISQNRALIALHH